MPLDEMVAAAAGTQKFAVSHYSEADFKHEGMRTYATYRDFGFTEPTGGLVEAHVIRLKGPCTDEVRKRHFHDVFFQMVYILKGGMKIEIEDVGIVDVKAGGCFILPAKAKHTVLDYDDGTEVIEINMPAHFRTIEEQDSNRAPA